MVKKEKAMVVEIIKRTPVMEKLRLKGYQKVYAVYGNGRLVYDLQD